MPFMHDELSTLARARYGSFSELIEKGVKGDYHPAGLQVFVWLWVKMVSISEFAVKLPFILCGIGSVFMSYVAGKKWFGETTALLAATYMATLQYTIVYGSLIARMYPLGLFFSLCMVYAWTKIVEDVDFSWKNSFVFVASAIFCTHLHHFAMLFTGIVCFSGLLLAKKVALKRYIFLLSLIFLAYLPNIPLLLAQIKEGGAEWMGGISLDFFRYYFSYLGHFSVWVAGCILILLGIGLKTFQKINNKKYHFLSLIWFLTPLVLGYTYSVLRAPVLQNYVLLFSFPYLLFFLFSFCQNWGKKMQIAGVFLICLTNISTLIFKREHFTTFYHQPYPDIYHISIDAKQKYGESLRSIHGLNPKYYAYYDSLQPSKSVYFPDYAADIDKWRAKIAQDTATYLLLAEVPLHYYLTAKDFFPYEIERKIGFTYETHLLSKKAITAPLKLAIYQETKAKAGILTLNLSKSIPYHAVFQADIVFVPDSSTNTQEVSWKVVQNGKTLFEQTQNIQIPPHNMPIHYYLTEKLRHIFTYTQDRSNCQLILNTPTNATLQIVEGNPYIYGLSYEIE